MKRFLSVLVLWFGFGLFSAGGAFASEGQVELVNVSGGSSRCVANTVLMRDFEMVVLVSCRDLIYPVSQSTFSYMLWAKSLDGEKDIRLGDLGIGKRQFETDELFSQLFVTEEKSNNPRKPGGAVVMSGGVVPYALLESGKAENPQVNTVINTQEQQKTTKFEEGSNLTNKAAATPRPSVQKAGISALRVIGILMFVAVVLVVVIAVVSSMRRRPVDS